MKRYFSRATPWLWVVLILLRTAAVGQDLKPIQLPKPQTDIGRPLMQVSKDRGSTRAFSSEKLPAQMLSNLLWAAFGVNRPESGKRTAPSAINWQEIDIYDATADGLYVYDAKAHQLNPLLPDDVRSQTGTQSYVKDALVNLVYVADLAKTKGASGENDFVRGRGHGLHRPERLPLLRFRMTSDRCARQR